MCSHLERCNDNLDKDRNKRQKSVPSSMSTVKGYVVSSPSYTKFDQETCWNERVKMVMAAKLPFRFVENEAFRKQTLLAVKLLGPLARFEASKLKVVLLEDQINKYASIIPRTYILSHCDFTANLTLTVSNMIKLEQLRGWYEKDDVVAEWKKVKNEMCLHVHCFVSGPHP